MRDCGVVSGQHPVVRVAARLARSFGERTYREKLIENCRVLKPDALLTVKGIGMTADVLSQIRASGVRTVMYYPDVHFDHPNVSVDSLSEYDLFVTTKTFQLSHLKARLGDKRVAYVPHGFSCRVHRPVFVDVRESDFRTDVLHAGNHSAYKQQWMEGLASALPDTTIQLVGNNWRKNASRGPLARCEMPGARMGIAYAEAIQLARINIAVHWGSNASGWQDLVSTRTFEIPACRGFMLHIDSAEVREFFEPGVEIDVFSSPEELADKVRFYLARPELRAEMIQRAYLRCVPRYSYMSRAKEIETLLRSDQAS